MNKDEKRELRRKRLLENKAYQTMNGLTRYMDRYYLDWGDAIALLSVVPFVYFSSRVIKSIPLTLAVLNNAPTVRGIRLSSMAAIKKLL